MVGGHKVGDLTSCIFGSNTQSSPLGFSGAGMALVDRLNGEGESERG